MTPYVQYAPLTTQISINIQYVSLYCCIYNRTDSDSLLKESSSPTPLMEN